MSGLRDEMKSVPGLLGCQKSKKGRIGGNWAILHIFFKVELTVVWIGTELGKLQ